MDNRLCKYCKKEFDKNSIANHSRWCYLNPKKSLYNKDLAKARAAKKNFNNQYTYGAVISKETIEKQRASNTGQKRTEKTKQKIKEKALASKHRRLKKGVVEYNGIILDSSWELELAKRLDVLEIEWVRPEPIPWVDEEGVTHNYFPDFYLPEHNKYLDPKNPYAVKVQDKKLKLLLAQYTNINIIDSLNGCKNFTLS